MSEVDYHIDVDLTDEAPAEGGGGLRLPRGTYHFKVVRLAPGQSNRSGNAVARFGLEVVDALSDDEECRAQIGEEITNTQSLNMEEKFVRERWVNIAQACGVEINKKGFNLGDFLEREFVAEVTHRTQTERDPVSGKPSSTTFMDIHHERPVGDEEGSSSPSSSKKPEKRTRRKRS